MITLGGAFAYYWVRQTTEFFRQVSGGAGFFNQAVNSRITSHFFGVKLSAAVSWRIGKNWGATVGAFAMPGYMNARMSAHQPAGTFGAAVNASDSMSGFAFRAGGHAGIFYDLSSQVRLSAGVSGSFMNNVPFLGQVSRPNQGIFLNTGYAGEVTFSFKLTYAP